MALYFGTTEITNIDSLVPQTGLDITDMWFGSTNVYTVWAVYEGTLPATFNANGDDMRQYQLYGNVSGVGDDSGTAYGYKLDMSVASPNMINVEPFKIGKRQSSIYVSLYRGKLKPGTYTVAILQENSITGSSRNTLSVQFGASYIFENATNNYHNNLGWHYLTFTVSSEQSNLTTNIQFWGNNLNEDCNYSNIMLLNGSVSPCEFIPYFNAVTPIYIGSDPLDKDEYIDYQAQKVYRMIDGTLTPTDPPVPLPALPTCEATIVDYAGQSQAVPEKVLLKYRKEGY